MSFLSYFYPGVDVTLMIKGELASKGAIKILRGGSIVGSVIGHKISIEGRVKGSIRSNDALEILQDGTVDGDATAMSLYIEPGAFYEGRCRIGLPPETAERENDAIDAVPAKKGNPSRWFWQK